MDPNLGHSSHTGCLGVVIKMSNTNPLELIGEMDLNSEMKGVEDMG